MIKRSLLIVSLVLCSCAHSQPDAPAPTPVLHHIHAEPQSHSHSSTGDSMNHSFKDAKKWSKAFDDPARDKWQRPDFVVESLELPQVRCVVDIGAGTGYFSTRIAHKLPPRAKIYAVDIEPDMVEFLKQRGQEEKLTNHVPILSSNAFPEVEKNCDLVLLVDTYHHISDRVNYFKNVRKYLSKKGRVAVIDFTKDSPIGPKKEHRLTKEAVTAEMKAAGYTLSKDVGGLVNQYFVIYQ
jgi:cyclopropane fatty-acyl-phospholipid synthase-like methyltransferase